jgi:hypothetical protein
MDVVAEQTEKIQNTMQQVDMTEVSPQNIEQQPVSKEEEEAQETLNALEKLPELMEKVCLR